MSGSPSPESWTCDGCQAENPADSDRCEKCWRHRLPEPTECHPSLTPTGNPSWTGAETAPFELGDLLFLFTIHILGGCCLQLHPVLGVAYLIVIVPTLIYMGLKIYWYRRHRMQLSQERKLSSFILTVLVVIMSLPFVFSVGLGLFHLASLL